MTKDQITRSAFLLAAGYGTRLFPITARVPKPLLTINSVPLIAWHLDRLLVEGFETVYINLSHQADFVELFINRMVREYSRFQSIEIIFLKEDPILGTGGALSQLHGLLKEPYFCMINTDILYDLSLSECWPCHQSDRIASMVLRKMSRERLNKVKVDLKNNDVLMIGSSRIGKYKGEHDSMVGFSGIHIIHQDLLRFSKRKKYACINHDIYPLAALNGQKVGAIVKEFAWRDLGTFDDLGCFCSDLLGKKEDFFGFKGFWDK